MPDTAERGNRIMAIFHFTVKIVGCSKGKSVISASAYLNGDVMKNEETGRISYYTSKKEVVYTSLMMCENAPPEWLHVPEENIKRFQQSIRYKRADDKDAALEKFKITFQKQRLWNEVLKIEKNADAQLGRSFEFSLPKEWSRQELVLCQEKVQVKHELFTSIICLMPHLFPFVLVLSNISFRSH